MSNTETQERPTLADDLIVGAEAIGDELGPKYTKRRTYHVLESGQIPAFQIGSVWHARRSTLRAFFEQREREAMAAVKGRGAEDAAKSRGPQPAPRRTRAA